MMTKRTHRVLAPAAPIGQCVTWPQRPLSDSAWPSISDSGRPRGRGCQMGGFIRNEPRDVALSLKGEERASETPALAPILDADRNLPPATWSLETRCLQQRDALAAVAKQASLIPVRCGCAQEGPAFLGSDASARAALAARARTHKQGGLFYCWQLRFTPAPSRRKGSLVPSRLTRSSMLAHFDSLFGAVECKFRAARPRAAIQAEQWYGGQPSVTSRVTPCNISQAGNEGRPGSPSSCRRRPGRG